MVKVLILIVLVFYVISKAGTFVTRLLFGQYGSHHRKHKRQQPQGAFSSHADKKKNVKNRGYDGGEYVEFEEIK